MNFSDIALLWVAWVLPFEGERVVREPNGGYSKWGVWRPNLNAARSVTIEQATALAGEHIAWIERSFPSVVRRYPVQALFLLDLAWNGGYRTATRIAAGDPAGIDERSWAHYLRLLRRPKYKKYDAGWRLRRSLISSLAVRAQEIDVAATIVKASKASDLMGLLVPWTVTLDRPPLTP